MKITIDDTLEFIHDASQFYDLDLCVPEKSFAVGFDIEDLKKLRDHLTNFLEKKMDQNKGK